MVVYIEYVFLENMLLDFTLLLLSMKAMKEKIKCRRLILSSVFGGIFSVIFPFIYINDGGRYALKLLFGAFMCFLTVFPMKSKKEWGRYARITLSFYFCTFCFGGMLTALNAEKFWIWIEFFFACVFFITVICSFYKRRGKAKFLYPCKLFYQGKSVEIIGYYDSGNIATYQGLPVCLLSPELAYSLFDFSKIFDEKREKIVIHTLGGKKQAPIFLGEIFIKEKFTQRKKVYFAVVGNMVSREHKLILHSKILEKDG